VSERILVVEDDPTLRRILLDNLIFEGYRAEAVSDGKAAIAHVRASAPDLVVLDLTLPDFDGLDLCPVLRQSGKVPIIILSARGQKADKLKGLKLGADDYITKPFDLQELLARISAVLRRSHPVLEKLMIGKLLIDFRSQRATSGQAAVHLTHREFELLRYLAERREKVVHREELLKEVWVSGHQRDDPLGRSRDPRLRKKIEPDPHHPEFIRPPMAFATSERYACGELTCGAFIPAQLSSDVN
jgi:DNA-binding response OmpR family regulator